MLLRICCQEIEFQPLWVCKCECLCKCICALRQTSWQEEGTGLPTTLLTVRTKGGEQYAFRAVTLRLSIRNIHAVFVRFQPGLWNEEWSLHKNPKGQGLESFQAGDTWKFRAATAWGGHGAPHPFPRPCSMCLFYLAVPGLYTFTITQWVRK